MKDDPLSDEDNVVRYVGGSKIDDMGSCCQKHLATRSSPLIGSNFMPEVRPIRLPVSEESCG